jgi:DNA polymerase III alpha subunit (gram-positive type)
MSGIIYYCLDLETTGLREAYHEITELSILRAEDRVQLSKQVKCLNPQNASFDALRITGKTMEDLYHGISPNELVEEVEEFLCEDGATAAHRCLVGHNIITFDKKFLWHLWETNGKRFPFDLYLDTLQMAKSYVKENNLGKTSLKLGSACDLFGIKKASGEHAAKCDTRNAYLLWKKLMEVSDHLKFIKQIPHIIEGELSESEEEFID